AGSHLLVMNRVFINIVLMDNGPGLVDRFRNAVLRLPEPQSKWRNGLVDDDAETESDDEDGQHRHDDEEGKSSRTTSFRAGRCWCVAVVSRFVHDAPSPRTGGLVCCQNLRIREP